MLVGNAFLNRNVSYHAYFVWDPSKTFANLCFAKLLMAFNKHVSKLFSFLFRQHYAKEQWLLRVDFSLLILKCVSDLSSKHYKPHLHQLVYTTPINVYLLSVLQHFKHYLWKYLKMICIFKIATLNLALTLPGRCLNVPTAKIASTTKLTTTTIITGQTKSTLTTTTIMKISTTTTSKTTTFTSYLCLAADSNSWQSSS